METLFLLMKKTRAKKFKVRMFYHLQKFVLGGFCPGDFWLGRFCPGGLSRDLRPGGFCPDTLPAYPLTFVLFLASRSVNQKNYISL